MKRYLKLKIGVKSLGSRNNNNVYGELIQLLIMDYLAQKKMKTVTISRTQLLREIEMTNFNYGVSSDNIPKLAAHIEAEVALVYDFYNTSNNNFKNAIEIALNALYDRRIIMHDKVTMVHKLKSGKTDLATEEEKDIIVEHEKAILKELNYSVVSEVRGSKDWLKFRDKVKRRLIEQGDIEYYFFAYRITVNQKYIEEELNNLVDHLLEDLKREEYKNELNSKVCDRLLENAEKRHEKMKKVESEEIFIDHKMGNCRVENTYVTKIKQLVSILIDNTYPEAIYPYLSEIKLIPSEPSPFVNVV